MARIIERGDIWRLNLSAPDMRRPVLVLSRQSLIRVLHSVTVASITSTVRSVPTEVEVGVEHGLKHASCVNLTNIYTVPKAQLSHYVGSLSSGEMRQVCATLAIVFAC